MTTRRGLALLLALACVVVVLAAAAATLSALAATQRTVLVTTIDDRLDDLLAGGEALAASWLAQHSAQAVLPPEGGPRVVASEDIVTTTGEGCLYVACYDTLAAAPIDVAAGQLRTALPGRWLSLTIPPPPVGGWPVDTLERLPIPDGLRRFPAVTTSATQVWAESGAVPALSVVRAPALAAVPSLVEVLAIPGDGRININTASDSLLREAYRLLALGEVDQLIERRRRLLFTDATTRPGEVVNQRPNLTPNRPPITLVDSSDQWSALVVARWNGARRSRWVVFAGNPPTQRIVQRHDADQ